MDVRVEPDRNHAWAAFGFVGVRVLAVSIVIGCGGFFDGALSFGDAALAALAFSVVLTVAFGSPMALWWWLRPGHVSYGVANGELRVYRGDKIVQAHPCADITSVSLQGALTWRELIARNWFNWSIDGWPELLVDRENWPKPQLLFGARPQPAILLWGENRILEAERDLREAVTRHGAILRPGL